MNLAHLAEGRQLDDCDATSRCTDRVEATAEGLSKSVDCAFDARPAVTKEQPCQLARTCSLRYEFALLVVASWIFLLRVESRAILVWRGEPTENMSGMGQVRSHSVQGMAGGHFALKLLRRKLMDPGAILTCAPRCEGHDPQGLDFRIPHLLRPVCSVWPVIRGRADVGVCTSPSFQSPHLIRQLRPKWARLNWPASDKIGTQSLRHGGARALM